MSFEQIIAQLNWIDWGVLVVLLIFAAGGIGRGFLFGVLDIAGLVVAVGIAELTHQQVLSALALPPLVPAPIAEIAVFLLVLLLAAILISVVIGVLRRIVDPFITFLGPIAVLERGLGIVPGLAKGLLFSVLLLVPFVLFPIVPDVTEAIEQSTVARELTTRALENVPKLEEVLGRPSSTSLSFRTPAPTGEVERLELGPLGALEPDSAAEEALLALVNQERVSAGLAPLELDERLREVARGHSQEMFELGYFAHESPVSGSPAERVRRAEIEFTLVGENLAFAPTVEIAHEGLMNSPSHRANILRPEFTRIGIGVIRSERQGRMFSQVFAD